MKVGLLISGGLVALALYALVKYNGDDVREVGVSATAPSASGLNVPPRKPGAAENSKSENNLSDVLSVTGSGKLLETLDQLNANGIVGTSQNIDELDARFRASKDSEVMLRLARLYNAAYFGTEDKILRQRISKTISELLRTETDPVVGRALALSHSRLVFDEYTKENLSFAFKSRFLSTDDYYGELAHTMLGAPVSAKSEIIQEIVGSKNRYAAEIIADLVVQSEKLEVSQQEASMLRKYLNEAEPGFGITSTSFGMIDAIRYEQWLRAATYFESQETASPANILMFNKLISVNTDPRAVVAVLLSSHASNLLNEPAYRTQLIELKQKAEVFIAANPSAYSLQDAGAQISRTFAGK